MANILTPELQKRVTDIVRQRNLTGSETSKINYPVMAQLQAKMKSVAPLKSLTVPKIWEVAAICYLAMLGEDVSEFMKEPEEQPADTHQ